ncbi:MAG: ABC transporter permease [Deltaproteobacteria bacterium]|nr:ABC transporter permease [Deltaproteobacteria bacterium]
MSRSTPRLWRRFRRNRGGVVGLLLLMALLAAAPLAPVLAPHGPADQDLLERLARPSPRHPLGTDDLGRDLLSRILYGARVSLLVGVVGVGIALSIGVPVGALAGFAGGRLDQLLMRAMDVLLSFPAFLLAVAIVGIAGPSLQNALLAIGVIGIPTYARLVRATVLVVKAEPYVEAAHALGAGTGRVLVRHVLPNCAGPLLVQATLGMGTAILEVAGLSFLGLGAQPPTPEWGAMLSSGRAWVLTAPWLLLWPGLAILLAVLGFTLVGDGLRDALASAQ